MFEKFPLTALLLLALIGPTMADSPPLYTVVPLQVYPGTPTEETAFCEPSALNNVGEAVGLAGAHGTFHAVRWDQWGRTFPLGSPSDKLDDARAINDKGQVVANGSTGKTYRPGFSWWTRRGGRGPWTRCRAVCCPAARR